VLVTPGVPDHTLADKDSDDMADSHSSKAPAFQFYPNDFLSDANVIVMSMQERGCYITLICVCWQQGSLPSDTDQLARFCALPVPTFRKLWPAVEKCFRASGADRLVHPRLEKERKKQREFRKLQSDKGKASAASRRATTVQPRFNSGSTEGQPDTGSPVQPKPNSSFSSSSSSSDSSQHERVRAFPPRDKSPSEVSDDVAQRAGRFCERYADLYAELRKGARYLGRPALDFQEATQLVATWDDARLEKIARVFLTTDHEFAEKGSRTMAQFRAMASWCDSRLVEAGIA
jgi:uncharacterized protein YdaU (DUF1376 family)